MLLRYVNVAAGRVHPSCFGVLKPFSLDFVRPIGVQLGSHLGDVFCRMVSLLVGVDVYPN